MNSPLKVTGIDHVVLHVKDLSRAKKFYVDFLADPVSNAIDGVLDHLHDMQKQMDEMEKKLKEK